MCARGLPLSTSGTAGSCRSQLSPLKGRAGDPRHQHPYSRQLSIKGGWEPWITTPTPFLPAGSATSWEVPDQSRSHCSSRDLNNAPRDDASPFPAHLPAPPHHSYLLGSLSKLMSRAQVLVSTLLTGRPTPRQADVIITEVGFYR